jgi:hypothetical protein
MPCYFDSIHLHIFLSLHPSDGRLARSCVQNRAAIGWFLAAPETKTNHQ